jgi:ribosomal protein L11 methyltransferase
MPSNMITSIDIIRRQILRAISDQENKMTPRDIETQLRRMLPVDRQQFQSALKALMAEGELSYTYLYGNTFIEKSFNRPVRVGFRVILTPSEQHPALEASDIAVRLKPGASFGTGQHPTTRLAVQGIETAMEMGVIRNDNPSRMLDIGTGSGVLAITALRLGIHQAVGTDVDPCAIAEAEENARINGLSERFKVLDVPAEEIGCQFDMIAANLRYPTLAQLCPYIASHVRENGAAVLSGIREEESEKLKYLYAERRVECRWEKCEKNWAGLILVKQSPVLNQPK